MFYSLKSFNTTWYDYDIYSDSLILAEMLFGNIFPCFRLNIYSFVYTVLLNCVHQWALGTTPAFIISDSTGKRLGVSFCGSTRGVCTGPLLCTGYWGDLLLAMNWYPLLKLISLSFSLPASLPLFNMSKALFNPVLGHLLILGNTCHLTTKTTHTKKPRTR